MFNSTKVAYICSECGRVEAQYCDSLNASYDFIACNCGGAMKNLRTVNRMIKGYVESIPIANPAKIVDFTVEIGELSGMIETLIENS